VDKGPTIRIHKSFMGIIIEMIALLGLLLPMIYIAVLWSKIPDIVPTHFGLSGQANAWGGEGVTFNTRWS